MSTTVKVLEEQKKGQEEKGAEPQQHQPKKGGKKGRQKGQAPVTSSEVGGASFGNQQGARKKDKFSFPVQEGSGTDVRSGCSTNKQNKKHEKKQREETTDQPLRPQMRKQGWKHKETHQEEREPQSPQHQSQKPKQKPKPTKGSNPSQAKKVPSDIDNWDDVLSNYGEDTQKWTDKPNKKRDKKQREETTGQPLPPQLQKQRWKHKETHQEEEEPQSPQHQSQKPIKKNKSTKGSHPSQAKKVPPGIDNLLDTLSEFGGATQNWTGKPHKTPLLETAVEFACEETSGKKTRQKKSAKGQRRGAEGTAVSRQSSTDHSDRETDKDVTIATGALGGRRRKVDRFHSQTDGNSEEKQTNDWCLMASADPVSKDTCETAVGNKKKRTRGRRKQSTDQNEGSIEADDLLVTNVSASAVGDDSELDTVLQNIQLKKQKALDKHEQKMTTWRDAAGEHGDVIHELEAQKSEFESSTRLLLARLRAVGHDATSTETTVQLRRRFGVECKRLETALPIYARRTDIVEAVRGNAVCVVLGETGSGKSTQLTQYIYEAGAAPGGKIVCTQPRKVAAISLATRVAQELATPLGGDLVGYRVGLQRRETNATALLYVTDHVLLNECQRDPFLNAYSCIIIDEAHERSIFTDLLLGMVKRCLASRKDLRVIITSATTDPEPFVRYFGGCPVLAVSGHLFPVDVYYESICDLSDSDHYMDIAVQKVKEIHASEPPGDVLVFVPSALDTQKGCDSTNHLEDVISLPLHNALPVSEQRDVFEPEIDGRRKIVFATNCAETSVTVPGIKYVVDTGLAKERTYDPKLNVSSLAQSVISRSSADQRKGRAGRTAPGTCYRLYSEECYDDMAPASTPEILRVHIGQAMLKLMDIGVDDPSSFDYIESPPPAAMKAAAVDLESLGATTNGRINDLGWRLSRLNVQPRLGKLLLLSVAAGTGYEGMVVTALSTTGGYISFRYKSEPSVPDTDDECEESGDLLTFVSLYKQWTAQPDRDKNRWCLENSVSPTFMWLARGIVTELKRTLKRELGVDVNLGSDSEAFNQVLPAILLDCYVDNLSFFSGIQGHGYALVANGATHGQTLHLHPSSAFTSLGTQPRWVIFEHIMVTSRPYMMNVTAINDDLVERFVADGRLPVVDVTALTRQHLHACPLPPVGPSVLRALTGRGLKQLERLEKEARVRCKTEMLMLDASFSESRLVVYVTPDLEDTAAAVVAEKIATEKSRLAAEDIEVALGGGGVRMVLGRGGAVSHLLMPDEYRTVVISDASDDADVMHALCRIGPMANYSRFKGKDKSQGWGIVTFDQPEHALRAVGEDSGLFSARPLGGSPGHAEQSAFTLKARWSRRTTKGHAYVMMKDPEDVIRSCVGTVLIRGAKVDVNINPKNDMQLFLKGLPSDASGSDISAALKRAVGDEDLSVTDVVIPRDDVGVASPGELGHLNDTLSAAIKKHVHTGGYRVEMIPPKEKDFDYNARISFTSAVDEMTALGTLEGQVTVGRKPVTFTRDLRTSFVVAKPVYDVIREELDQVATACSRGGTFVKVPKKSFPNTRHIVVLIYSDDRSGLQAAADAVRRVVQPKTVEFESTEEFRCVTGPAGREELRRIEADTGAKITVDARLMKVLVHGPETARRRAAMAVDRFVADNKTLLRKEVLLGTCGNTVRLVKLLLTKYGVDLEQLQGRTGALYLELQLRRNALVFRGTEDAYESLQMALRENEAQLTDVPTTTPSDDSPDCPVCFCPIVEGDIYRLEYCGHAYCRPCIGALLQQKCRDADFPAACVQEDCGESVVLRDLTNLLGHSPEAKSRWHRAAVKSLVKTNPGQYNHCLTPDCPTVYRAATSRDDGVRFRCCQCSAVTCTACQVHYHDGVTCAAYQATTRADDVPQKAFLCEDDLETWLAEDSTNRLLCPSCAVPVQTNPGSDHVECDACHVYICGTCKATFERLSETHDHLSKCLADD